jgi:hypothetical protein
VHFDNLKKQAKQLVRWHRAGNYSVGGRIRRLVGQGHALYLKVPFQYCSSRICRLRQRSFAIASASRSIFYTAIRRSTAP